MQTTKKLTTSALLVALSIVLMWASKLIPAPWLQGGNITLASMVPIILIGILFGIKWGICSSFAYTVIQILLFGFYPPPTRTVSAFILVILLDYLLAYGVLGLGGLICNPSRQKAWLAAVAAFTVTMLRYVCHIISGILIWGVYAEEGQSVLTYSLIYNGSYMIPEIIISTMVIWLLFHTRLPKKLGFGIV